MVGDMIEMGEYHGGPIKASQVIAIAATSEHPAEAAALIQFLFGDEEGATILGDSRGIPCNKNAVQYVNTEGSLVADMNAKLMAWSTFKLDTITERAALKAPDGVYTLTIQMLSYGEADADACADMLNKRGHTVTVYEKNDRIGGLLMYGIPNMKLDKSIIDRRVQLMRAEGVRFLTGTDVGRDIAPETLLEQFDAVVLCCGAEQARDIQAEGREQAEGIYFAVDFLTRNTKSYLDSNFADGQYIDAKGKNVVIVGGGDTGNDCVGTVIRQGCQSVVQLELMPKSPDSRAADNPWPEYPKTCKTDYGQEEAIAVFGHDPRRYSSTIGRVITDDDGHITAVGVVRMEADKKGRLRSVPGSEEVIDCDLLLIAAGFTGCKKYVADAFGVDLSPRNTVQTEAGKYASSVPGVFAAGDMRRGQSLVVWAIEEGRSCAKEVDAFLDGYSNM